jgi:hypothetical protein
VLQIAIHGDDVFAARVVETGGETSRLTEVAAQLYNRNTAVDGSDFAKHAKGVILGTVVNQHNFKTLTCRFHDDLEAVVQIGNILLLVMERDHDGIFRHGNFIIA